jgi:hypothetical protein
MANAMGETKEPLRVAFGRDLKLEFHGGRITSDAGLLACRDRALTNNAARFQQFASA